MASLNGNYYDLRGVAHGVRHQQEERTKAEQEAYNIENDAKIAAGLVKKITPSNYPVPLPRYDFVGQLAKNEELVAGQEEYLRSATLEILAPEIEKGEYEQQFVSMTNAICELGEGFGLDLTDRRRDPEYLHLFTEKGYQAVREQFNARLGSRAIHSTSGHMLATLEKKERNTQGNINHELVHVMSRKSIRPAYVDSSIPIIRANRSHDGYESHRHGTFKTVNEILTEVTNIDLMRNYWPRQGALKGIAAEDYNDIGYPAGVIFMDELLKEHFEDPLLAFKFLEEGLFTGEVGRLRSLTERLGVENMQRLATVGDTPKELAKSSRKIRRQNTKDLLEWL